MSIKPMTITFTNLMKYISLMSPLLIIFFIIMISIFNNTLLKGLIFTFGLAIVTFFNYILKNLLKEKQSPLASSMCNILPQPFTVISDGNVFSSPGLSSSIIGYTLSYLVFPMKVNNQVNPALVTFLLALLGINGMIEIHDHCTSVGGVILGAVVGVVFGLIYYSIIAMTGYKELAYFSEIISNNTKCSKPSEQKFKCVTYYRSGKHDRSHSHEMPHHRHPHRHPVRRHFHARRYPRRHRHWRKSDMPRHSHK